MPDEYPKGSDYLKDDLGYKRIKAAARLGQDRSAFEEEDDLNAKRLAPGTDMNIYARDVVELNLSSLTFTSENLPAFNRH